MYPTHYIFNHFNKTGGTSLVSVFRANLDAADISPTLLDNEIRMMPERFEHYRLITGHLTLPTHMRFSCSRYSMTLLREPVARVVSSYSYWRKALERNILTTAAKEMSFADFVHYFIDSPLINNNYSHFYAAVGDDCPGYPPDAAARLAAAKSNLAAFDFVGITEEFPRSVRLLCHELGWRVPDAIPHVNRSGSENLLSEIDSQTLEILQARNQLDSELYRYAARLLHAREALMLSGSTAASPRTLERNRLVPLALPRAFDRRAIIQKVAAIWSPDEPSRVLEVTVDFATTTEMAELSLHVQVHDTLGNLIWTANTTNDLLDLDWDAAFSSRAKFLLKCELPQGVYLVSVGLFDPRRYGFFEHWIDRATLFEVTLAPIANPARSQRLQLQSFQSTLDTSVRLRV